MDLLRNLFGSLTSGIIRLAVTAGVLLLCYLFIVKPALDTTNEAIKSSGIDQIGTSPRAVGRAAEPRAAVGGGAAALEGVEAAGAAPEVVNHVDEDALAGGGNDGRAMFE